LWIKIGVHGDTFGQLSVPLCSLYVLILSSVFPLLNRKPIELDSPVLVVDALGFSAQIRSAGVDGLKELALRLEQQYHMFRAKVPHRAMLVGRKCVWGTNEYATLRLNDMFILHAGKPLDDLIVRFMLCGSMLFQTTLLTGLVPRGGLGAGAIYRSRDILIGNGFIDAYESTEARDASSKDICAIQVSPSFLKQMPNTKRAWQLLCFYEGHFYVHPWSLVDPQMGPFSPERILHLLKNAGANKTKLNATEMFLNQLEDYEAAKKPGSITRRLRDDAGEPWTPKNANDKP